MKFVTFRICQALLARVLFLCHSLLAVGHTANVLANSYWWLLALANLALVMETIYTVVKRKGEETRWICPSAVFYLLATVPAICLLELDRLERHFDVLHNETGLIPTNVTNVGTSQVPTSPIDWVADTIGLPIKLSPDLWVEVIEQLLLLLLIIGRWLMPKGRISRDELSQLLFVYIAIASDIMELFELFEEESVYENEPLRYSILIVWGISLSQFTLALTASRNPKKARPGASASRLKPANREASVICCREPYIEILSLLMSLFIMDGPFLAIRLFVLISLRVLTYNIIFFTSKNLLMVLLLLYRFVVIVNDIKKRQHLRDEESIKAFKMRSLKDQSQSVSDLNLKEAGESTSPSICVDKEAQYTSQSCPSTGSRGDDSVMFERDDPSSTFEKRLSNHSSNLTDSTKAVDFEKRFQSGVETVELSSSVCECDQTGSSGEQTLSQKKICAKDDDSNFEIRSEMVRGTETSLLNGHNDIR